MSMRPSKLSHHGQRFLTSADGRSQLPLQGPGAASSYAQPQQTQYKAHSAAQLSTSEVFGSPKARIRQARVFQISQRIGFVPFNNTEPRTRAYRHAQLNKESLEKQRLVERKGGFHKYEKIEAVTQYEQGTVGYMPESGRFDTDIVGEEWRRRKAEMQRSKQIYSARREENVVREEERFARMDAMKEAEKQKYTRYRQDPMMGKKNVGSMPFDVVTLKYNDGADGARLAYEDEQIKYRAALRAKNLHEKSNRAGYNPVTGTDGYQVAQPAEPVHQASYAHADHSHW